MARAPFRANFANKMNTGTYCPSTTEETEYAEAFSDAKCFAGLLARRGETYTSDGTESVHLKNATAFWTAFQADGETYYEKFGKSARCAELVATCKEKLFGPDAPVPISDAQIPKRAPQFPMQPPPIKTGAAGHVHAPISSALSAPIPGKPPALTPNAPLPASIPKTPPSPGDKPSPQASFP